MLILLCSALAIGLLASWIHALQWRVPYALLPLKTILRDWVGVGLFAMLLGLVARLLARITGAETSSIDLVGMAVALIGGAIWALLIGHSGGLLRGLLILCGGVLNAETRNSAQSALERWLARAKKSNQEVYQHAAVLAVASYCHIGEWRKALTLLATIDEATLPEEVRKVCVQNRQRCESELGLDKNSTELMT